MGALRLDPWVVNELNGFDVITHDGMVAGKILWLRELRYPNMCRDRMASALNGQYTAGPGSSRCWTADGANKVWLLLHNGATIGELHTAAAGPMGEGIRDRVLAGLNMRPGRRPEACEPMPVTPVIERHLRLVR